jgi:predicted pyridoxine 5'-phosphate oxidase superfamily flavin-nucleotide-binding protein
MTPEHDPLDLDAIERCFAGAIPAVLATASADGTPNVTYISKAHRVDSDRLALSNQFMSKTARNLADNPRASLLLIDPTTHDEFRLSLRYERTERRGHVFDRLRHDVDVIAEMEGMQDVFRLRAATIFRVEGIEQIEPNPLGSAPEGDTEAEPATRVTALADLAGRISRCSDLDMLIDVALDGLDDKLGYHHTHLLLVDEEARCLYTIGSRGFDADSVGAEVVIGEGPIGVAAARCEAVRIGNLRQMAKYSRSIRQQFVDAGGTRPGRELRMPGLGDADSRMVVPVMSLGALIGVIVVDDQNSVAFTAADEHIVSVVATVLGSAIEHARRLERGGEDALSTAPPRSATDPTARATIVRFFDVDGSTFLNDDYLIKGVAGRILWTLLRHHAANGRVEFTNRELRLDASLQLPGFKDNLESRLILLKRRLDERGAPIRLERTGRGRFHLDLTTPLHLDGDA